jgi:hypothetical protein
MEPKAKDNNVASGTALAVPAKIGEIEDLIHQLSSAADNLEMEVGMLFDRLNGVLRAEDKTMASPSAAPRTTRLGGQLDTVLYRTEAVTQALRNMRENLEV